MKKIPIVFWVVFAVIKLTGYAWGEQTDHITTESMIGKYDGVIQVIKLDAILHPYQIEILSVDSDQNTVSLSAHCPDCAKKELKRNDCKITEIDEKIRFTCKGPTSDEEYTFNGSRLKASGFGHNYPYTINLTKVTR